MQNDTAPAWPDPARPGVPLNPEQNGWHWLQCDDHTPETYQWHQADWRDGRDGVPIVSNPSWRYLGPCLTPQEVAALQSAAFAAGAKAMKQAGVTAIDGEANGWWSQGMKEAAAAISHAGALLRALPLPPMPGQQGGSDAG